MGDARVDDESKAPRPTLAGTLRALRGVAEKVDGLDRQVRELLDGADHEAAVAGRCAKALGELAERERRAGSSSGYVLPPSYSYASGSTSTYPYQPLFDPPSGPVPRVLDYLRQRHGIPDPAAEAKRLSDELQRAYERVGELEGRLQQISAAVPS